MAQCPDNNKIDFRNDRKTNETKGNITGDIQLLDMNKITRRQLPIDSRGLAPPVLIF